MFKERVARARAAAKFAAITQRDEKDRVRTVSVPGSNGKQYQVILRRHGGILSGECRVAAGPLGFIPCKASPKYACAHVMAAALVAISDSGYRVQFTNSEPKARKLENLGLKAYRLRPWRNGRGGGEAVWILVKANDRN